MSTESAEHRKPRLRYYPLPLGWDFRSAWETDDRFYLTLTVGTEDPEQNRPGVGLRIDWGSGRE